MVQRAFFSPLAIFYFILFHWLSPGKRKGIFFFPLSPLATCACVYTVEAIMELNMPGKIELNTCSYVWCVCVWSVVETLCRSHSHHNTDAVTEFGSVIHCVSIPHISTLFRWWMISCMQTLWLVTLSNTGDGQFHKTVTGEVFHSQPQGRRSGGTHFLLTVCSSLDSSL